MKRLLSFTSLILMISCCSCAQVNYMEYNGKTWEQISGSGKLVTLKPSIDAFTTVEVNNLNVKIVVETGAKEHAMNISIDDNLKDFFRWKQEGSTLKLSFDLSGGKYPRWLSGNNTVITIKAPVIEKVINKGNSNVDINLSGQPAFYLWSEGNPDITISGTVTTLNLESSGNSDINAGKLAAGKINLSSNGNADIEVNTKELVEKDIKGNNDIVNVFYTSKKDKTSGDYSSNSDNSERISFKIKNNSLLPAKVTLISYQPGKSGNGTNGFMVISFGSKTFSYPVGTKIYLANSEQVNTVMSGAKISDQTPFLIVKKEDEGKSFNIK